MSDTARTWEEVAIQAEALELVDQIRLLERLSAQIKAILLVQLELVDQVRLLERLSAQIKATLLVEKKAPKRSLYGLSADLGPGPSTQDIDEARRNMLRGFPREDIA